MSLKGGDHVPHAVLQVITTDFKLSTNFIDSNKLDYLHVLLVI